MSGEKVLFLGDSITRQAKPAFRDLVLRDGNIAPVFIHMEGARSCDLRFMLGNRKYFDVISVLIGVNDFLYGDRDHRTFADFGGDLSIFLEELSGAKIIVCEPFYFGNLRGFRLWQEEARRLGENFNFVSYSEIMNKSRCEPDGIHPTSDGTQEMAEFWLKCFKELKKEIEPCRRK